MLQSDVVLLEDVPHCRQYTMLFHPSGGEKDFCYNTITISHTHSNTLYTYYNKPGKDLDMKHTNSTADIQFTIVLKVKWQ